MVSAEHHALVREAAAKSKVLLKNDRAGDEVAQLYVDHEGAQVDRVVKDLKGLQRLQLEAGETKTVAITLQAAQRAYCDETQHGWVVEPIGYTALVGPSSRSSDLRRGQFRIK